MFVKSNFLSKISIWFDNNALQSNKYVLDGSIDYWRVVPFVLIHIACFALILVGYSTFSVLFAVALYALRMFAITGFYHRYFAHKAFKTSLSWFTFLNNKFYTI